MARNPAIKMSDKIKPLNLKMSGQIKRYIEDYNYYLEKFHELQLFKIPKERFDE